MRFKTGQAVTLRQSPEGWIRRDTQALHSYGPKFGEVVHVEFYSIDEPNFMCFVEYPHIDPSDNDRHYYWEDEFEPLISDSVLFSELESIPETFTI